MNVGSLNTQNTTNYINQNKTSTQEALSRIAASRELSGKDNANLVIADALGSQISSLSQGIQNSNEAVGMLQIADGTLSNLSQSADRLNQLSTRYNSAALNSEQRSMLAGEFNATQKSMQEMVDATTYNGKSLFGNSLSFETGTGINTVPTLDVNGLSQMSIDNSDSIQSFLQNIDMTRSSVGSSMQQFQVGITNSLSALSNVTNSSSLVEETPMDTKINDQQQAQIKLQSSILVQAHQNDLLQKRVSALLV
jgi:flagellin